MGGSLSYPTLQTGKPRPLTGSLRSSSGVPAGSARGLRDLLCPLGLADKSEGRQGTGRAVASLQAGKATLGQAAQPGEGTESLWGTV